ncbi:hypothetical protein FK220_018625 [Flavobacteriaceae bacterium TP-CH-4]|uniref:Uncharacterized protein n=1 Tax=Pelagihabitans pacificus TaxID=2696054 RepID=A0A967B3J4_9FLAO|nr:hypothetical protein [Pelagihabitans pacificus]NHF61376.1 hypothetical protein [Pelagihabitans pacificus]
MEQEYLTAFGFPLRSQVGVPPIEEEYLTAFGFPLRSRVGVPPMEEEYLTAFGFPLRSHVKMGKSICYAAVFVLFQERESFGLSHFPQNKKSITVMMDLL